MNNLEIIGNLTADPELRVANTANGPQNVCNFTVANNRIQNGQKIVEYFRVTLWNKSAENAKKYLSKGNKVYVSGPVTASAYAANDGTLRASLDVQARNIEYLSSKRDQQNGQGSTQYPQNSQDAYQQQNYQGYYEQPQDEASYDGFMPVPPMNDMDMPFG